MSMGSAPVNAASSASASQLDSESSITPRSVGPKTAATLQSVYRLFKPGVTTDSPASKSTEEITPTTGLNETSSVSSQAPAALPEAAGVLPQSDVANEEEALLTVQPRSPSPPVHERSVFGSSATSVLKQIQAQQAARSSADSDRGAETSMQSSRRGSLSLEADKSDEPRSKLSSSYAEDEQKTQPAAAVLA